ncbi:MAG: hypothetical protein RJA70_2598 [Pseudomonadota bacterium]|jgi:hemerythrin superfamily protein
MKATDLLKQQHRAVEKLFNALATEQSQTKKTQLFETLASTLMAHDAIEREIFYPACEKAMGLNEVLGEAIAEHSVIEFCLYEAEQAIDKDAFTFKCKVLREIVDHHVVEEESELFPAVDDAISTAELKSLSVEMNTRFQRALTEDFRELLYSNLKQVLAGAIEPKRADPDPETNGSALRKSATRPSAKQPVPSHQ